MQLLGLLNIPYLIQKIIHAHIHAYNIAKYNKLISLIKQRENKSNTEPGKRNIKCM